MPPSIFQKFVIVVLISIWSVLHIDLREYMHASTAQSWEFKHDLFMRQHESGSNNNNNISTLSATTTTCLPQRPLSWEWNFYSNDETMNETANIESNNGATGDDNGTMDTNKTKSKNMLIAMYAGYDRYASMLELTAPINKAYARKWKQDLVILQGTSYTFPEVDGVECAPHGRRTTLNKIKLLLLAIKKRGKYDQILILDTDGMIFDFDVDITTLLPDNYMLAAHRVQENSSEVHTYNVNAGITLWNLKHRMTRKVAKDWEKRSVLSVETKEFKGDQSTFHKTLKKTLGAADLVYSSDHEFAYSHATVIKHFIRRSNHMKWTDPKILDQRVVMINSAIEQVCSREAGVCDDIDQIPYASL